MNKTVIIPHYPLNGEVDSLLRRCVRSLPPHEERVIVVNFGLGFAKAVNEGFKQATTDYFIQISNDVEWTGGSLEDLCVPDVVTSPVVNGTSQPFWGCVFCVPRTVYEKIGGLDESFGLGYYEDDDYIKRLEQAGVEMRSILSCSAKTEGGQTLKFLDTKELVKKNKEYFDEKWK